MTSSARQLRGVAWVVTTDVREPDMWALPPKQQETAWGWRPPVSTQESSQQAPGVCRVESDASSGPSLLRQLSLLHSELGVISCCL